MKKAIILILLLALASTALFFCGCEKTPSDGNTPTDEETTQSIVVTEPQTAGTPFDTPVRERIRNNQFGLPVNGVTVSNDAVAEAEIVSTGIIIYAKASGKATVNVKDCFGHTASADLIVAEDKTVTTEIHKTEAQFVEVRTHYGAAANGVTDDTAAIQKAIDDAKPGDTVYVSAGIYKVTLLVMREGVTLELYTTMQNATDGFTDELARQAANGEIAVFEGVRIMNNANNQPGAQGSSHFTIRGGVLDMLGTLRGAIIFGCADGAILENVIFKDVANNHAIQLTGCVNSVVRNCLFAGYSWGGTFTREVLQVEPSTPGATGTPPTSPLTFSNGEYNYPENIEITGCYFGKSDKYGAPIMAIGHHSYAGEANVTGFKITNNVFDEVLYAAIRYNNVVDAEISGNTFISTSKYMNVSDPSAVTPAFIIIYSPTNATTYANVVNGTTVTKALATEQSGTHGLKITGNTFNIGVGSDKRVIYVTGTQYNPGLIYSNTLIRQKKYNTSPYPVNGYTECTNYISDLTFSGNTIKIEGQTKYSNYFMCFSNVFYLDIADNVYEIAPGVSYTTTNDGINGLLTRVIDNAEKAARLTINAGISSAIIKLNSPDGAIALKPTSTLNIVLNVTGEGRIYADADAKGNGNISVVPADGYVFDGWYDATGKKLTAGTLILSAGAKYNAVFKAK